MKDPMHTPLEPNTMRQFAPFPQDLADAVNELKFEEGYTFRLADLARDYADAGTRREAIAGGLTFIISVQGWDAYHPGTPSWVDHYHPVPAATFTRAAWERWLFDRVMDTLTHEAGEWFRFECELGHEELDWEGDASRRPFAPLHGPGDNPYVVHQASTDEQRRTSFRGVVSPT